MALQWRHNEHDGISNHRHLDCLLNCLFRCRSKKTSKLCITGLCEGNSPLTVEFPAPRASNVEYVSIWWHHHGLPVAGINGCIIQPNNRNIDVLDWIIELNCAEFIFGNINIFSFSIISNTEMEWVAIFTNDLQLRITKPALMLDPGWLIISTQYIGM